MHHHGIAQHQGARVHVLGETHLDRTIRRQPHDGQLVNHHLIRFRAGRHTHALGTGVNFRLTGRAAGTGEARVNGGRKRPTTHIIATVIHHVFRQGEIQGIIPFQGIQHLQRVAGQVGDFRGGGHHIFDPVLHRAVRGNHQGIPAEFPAERLGNTTFGEHQCGARINALRLQRFAEVNDNGLTRFHAVCHIARLPGQFRTVIPIQNGNDGIHGINRLDRCIFLILIGLHAEAENPVAVFHAQHPRLHHGDGIGVELAVLNQAGAHQFQMHQVLRKGPIGAGVGGGGRHIHHQPQLLGCIVAFRIGVGEQITGSIGNDLYRHFPGIKAHRHFTANKHFQRITGKNAALPDPQRGDIREVGGKRQLRIHVTGLLGYGLVLQQGTNHRHAVDRLTGQFGGDHPFIQTAQGIIRRRCIGHQYRPLTGGGRGGVLGHGGMRKAGNGFAGLAEHAVDTQLIGLTGGHVFQRVHGNRGTANQQLCRHQFAVAHQADGVTINRRGRINGLGGAQPETGEIHAFELVVIREDGLHFKAGGGLLGIQRSFQSGAGGEIELAVLESGGFTEHGDAIHDHLVIRCRRQCIHRRQHHTPAICHGFQGEGHIRAIRILEHEIICRGRYGMAEL